MPNETDRESTHAQADVRLHTTLFGNIADECFKGIDVIRAEHADNRGGADVGARRVCER